ncbi:S8 family serine peptidase [Amycolatopsis acidicola]|uniref:S8 family serine peptidase n=1 Tax=Amycolatopsis acidicola TaxID=2596893 RepID=A0A5N0V4Q6_9PSEU|nr:S8 family serine peptidase [Amycolatopsis acidicola]KAA9160358.1 S8 family serine peptidase [Amycolatopsis acidicola]
MSRPGLALCTALTLAVALLAPAANAEQPGGTRLEPVCAGQFQRLACQVERVVGGYDDDPDPVGWSAQDLQKAYELPSTANRTGTIAIIDVGAYPNLEGDLARYRAQFGLPPCTAASGCFRQVDFHGGPPLRPSGGPDGASIDEQIAVETALDVDMASAACPGCRITEVQIPSTEVPSAGDSDAPPDYDGYADAFGTAVQTAIAQGADAVSISYGLPGDDHMLHGPVAAQLAHRGTAIVAASGDSGFEANKSLWPQALPTVTAVGGTELVRQSGRFSEGAWSGAGSSCVPGVAPPEGQPEAITKSCGGSRASVDVSAAASDLAVYDSYAPESQQPPGWTVVAGTSAAAPIIAGIYAASGGLADVLGPNTLYRAHSGTFQDVTSGTSGTIGNGRCLSTAETDPGKPPPTFDGRLCAAGEGWDGPTGLGTPHGLFHF